MKLNAIQIIFSKTVQSISDILYGLLTKQTHAVEKVVHYFLQYIGITLENIAITFPLQEAVKPPLKSSR